MSLLRRAAAAIAAAALILIAAPPAYAASGVYGGSTSAAEPIALTSDVRARKLRSAVIALEAPCQDGRRFPVAIELTAATAEAGFSPGPRHLVVSRNAGGRFAGTQHAGMDLGSQGALIATQLSGRLRPKRASGRLSATISIVDDVTGTEVSTCETGSLTWSASRSPGRIYAGRTSQEEPVVARLDRRGRTISDLLVGWETSACVPPDRYVRVGDRFGDFRIRGNRFGGTLDSSFPSDDGGLVAFAYDVRGTVSRRSLRRSLNVKVTTTDTAGATTMSCDSGRIGWRAATG